MKLTYALLRKQRTHNLRYIVRTLLMKLAPDTFEVIDHEIVSTAIFLASADSRRVIANYKGKYVHEVQVKRLVKLAQGKSAVR